jgi:hypothetical protein
MLKSALPPKPDMARVYEFRPKLLERTIEEAKRRSWAEPWVSAESWAAALPQHIRQLCNVDRDPPRLVACEPVHYITAALFVLEIDVRERLPIGVTDAEALGGLVDGPGRREAAGVTAVSW